MQAAVVSFSLVSATIAQPGPRLPGARQPSTRQPSVRQPQFAATYGPIQKDELEQQQQAFKQWWGDDLVVKLADLPAEGKVPDFRVPYCGHDYPDRGGGTLNAMYKYDQAYHRSRSMAAEYERMDISAHRNGRSTEEQPTRGLFGRLRNARGNAVPTWYGHCNGWTAAAIRHAEPQTSVVRNGVTFTPADIKGLLAEIYMYSDSVFLGGIDPAINPGTLHIVLANWLGRGSHPLGMETAVGEVVINFPLFNYKSVINKLSERETEVRTTITYALNINREQDKGPPKYHRALAFHYALELDDSGNIRGGRFFGDSQLIDMLWTPLKPAPGGKEGNLRGNPHLDIKEVLAIWRESVPEDLRKQWLNIDPTEEDRILPAAEALAANERPADAASDKPAETATASAETTETAASAAAESSPTAAPAAATESPTTPAAAPPAATADAAPPAAETPAATGTTDSPPANP